jgi:hypothetical protein
MGAFFFAEGTEWAVSSETAFFVPPASHGCFSFVGMVRSVVGLTLIDFR